MKNEMKNDRIDSGGGLIALRKYKVTSDRAKFYTDKGNTHMTSLKIIKFSRPLTPSVHLRPKCSTPLTLDVQILTKLPPPLPQPLQQTMEQQPHRACKRTKSKQKQNQVTSHSNWPRVLLFDSAHKQCSGIIKWWVHCLTPETIGIFLVNNISKFDSAFNF